MNRPDLRYAISRSSVWNYLASSHDWCNFVSTNIQVVNNADENTFLLRGLVELTEEMSCLLKDKASPVLTDPIDSLKVRKLLDMSRTTLYRKTVDGTIPSVRIGGRHYYDKSQIFKIRDHYLK